MTTGAHLTQLLSFYEAHHSTYAGDRLRITEWLERHHVTYGPWTVMFEMAPLILEQAERRLLATAAENVLRAAEAFTALALRDAEYQAQFPWRAEFWDLVRVDPGYALSIPCSRLDSFFDGTRLTFIELNTDGCSGMSNADTFHAAHQSVVQARTETGTAGREHDEVVPRVIDTLLGCYAEFRERYPSPRLPAQPVLGILDWRGVETAQEFNAIAARCAERGIAAHVVAPETAAFDGTRLTFKGTEVHLIYRRLLGEEYEANLDKLAAVSAAYRDHKVCMVGSPRSQIAFSKNLFGYLQTPRVLEQLPGEIRDTLQRHLPWTRPFAPMHTEFRGEPIDLLPFVTEHKDDFVLKPAVSKCGEGIFLGNDTPADKWRAALNNAIGKDHIVQEFIPIPTAEYPRLTKTTRLEHRYVHIGEYVFGGKFSGFLGRTCAHPLLSVRHGERLVAVLH